MLITDTISNPRSAQINPADALSDRFTGARGQSVARIATCLTAAPPADGILLNPSHPFLWTARLTGDESCCSTDERGTVRMQLCRHCFKNSRFELHELCFFRWFSYLEIRDADTPSDSDSAIPLSSRPALLAVDIDA